MAIMNGIPPHPDAPRPRRATGRRRRGERHARVSARGQGRVCEARDQADAAARDQRHVTKQMH
eukprot:5716122-Prymnesium_polylepis.1